MKPFTVLIAGAGLGGLCLAQCLRQAGINVQVFERDKSPWDRPQGYRLHIDSDGLQALSEALSPECYELFDATAMKPQPFTTIVDTSFRQLRRVPSEHHGKSHSESTAPNAHVNVDRATLRQILLTGLEDVVHFGEKLNHYESDGAGVTAFFENGQTVRGSVLVGADGIRSAVRKQRLPTAQTQDSGVRAIYGRIPMESALKVLPEQALNDVFTVAVDGEGRFFGLGPVVFPVRPDLAAATLLPKTKLREQGDYVVCVVGGRHELFGRKDATLRQLSSQELQKLAENLISDWPNPTRTFPVYGDSESFFFVEMFTSVPTTLFPSPNTTLLGDAVHAMTPTLGRGANVAMRDAARLASYLRAVAEEALTLDSALSDYETEMSKYGFEVVRESAALGVRLMRQNPLPK
jgi:2-polyprenyl-6-methoxyphenol hydroxylase-like FAD-dependent oxidoreductase